jgi:hypothetical protein
MSIKEVTNIANRCNSYKAYIQLLNNYKGGNEAPKGVEIRKAVKDKTDGVLAALLVVRLVCQLVSGCLLRTSAWRSPMPPPSL